MSIYGYHRTSSQEQHLDRGIKEITDFCKCNNFELKKIYTDQQTGKNFNRPRYTIMKEDVLRSGDILIISELDRLGRNKQDTLKELQFYKDNDIRVMILEIPTTLQDLSKLENSMAKMIMDTINNMLIELYATMAQAEIEKKEKRQQEGIQAKKDRGEWSDYGRPKAMDFDLFKEQYQKVVDGYLKPFECMRQLGMTKPTFYRYKKQFEGSIK
jgi:DNA invertase Pin-like site-specific DNA recombinase